MDASPKLFSVRKHGTIRPKFCYVYWAGSDCDVVDPSPVAYN